MLKFPSESVNPTNQCLNFLSKLINFLFDSTTRTEFNWLHILSTFGVITNNKIIIKKLVGVT